MELDSYYDGVHGWSGAGQRMTPLIAPGESFIVRFTPPRAGTFMYHTHLHDDRQLPSGLYGAMIVVDRGAVRRRHVDHVFVIGRGGPQPSALTVVNGENRRRGSVEGGRDAPRPPDQHHAERHLQRVAAVRRRPRDVAPGRQGRRGAAAVALSAGAARQTIGVGETYDFEVQAPPGR